MALHPHRWRLRYVVVPIAVALIAAVGIVLPAFLNRHAEERDVAGHLQPPGLAALVADQKPEANGKVYVRETAREIVKSVRNMLPLSRAEVFKSTYAGRWVRWRGTILRIVPNGPPGDTFFIIVRDPSDALNDVLLDFASEQRGTLEQLREGDVIDYEAQIKPELAEAGGNVGLRNVASVKVVEARKDAAPDAGRDSRVSTYQSR
jgi:hypothetical protein